MQKYKLSTVNGGASSLAMDVGAEKCVGYTQKSRVYQHSTAYYIHQCLRYFGIYVDIQFLLQQGHNTKSGGLPFEIETRTNSSINPSFSRFCATTFTLTDCVNANETSAAFESLVPGNDKCNEISSVFNWHTTPALERERETTQIIQEKKTKFQENQLNVLVMVKNVVESIICYSVWVYYLSLSLYLYIYLLIVQLRVCAISV